MIYFRHGFAAYASRRSLFRTQMEGMVGLQCLATEEEAERSPRIVKYIRLESYEDALDSIEFEQTSEQMELVDTSDRRLAQIYAEVGD